jgi:hypothetical protein
MLSALAASTTRIELGQLVTCASFRNPALLAKMAVTIDAVSGGRTTLDLGAGWDDTGHIAFGYPIDQRVGRFAEALEILCPLLLSEHVTFDGRYHRVREAVVLPPPEPADPDPRRGQPPSDAATDGTVRRCVERRLVLTPRRAATARIAALDAALDGEGRDPSAVRRTVGVRFQDRVPAYLLPRAPDDYEALGFDDVIVGLEPLTKRSVDALAIATRQRAVEPIRHDGNWKSSAVLVRAGHAPRARHVAVSAHSRPHCDRTDARPVAAGSWSGW